MAQTPRAMAFRDLTIERKLRMVIACTVGVGLVMVSLAFVLLSSQFRHASLETGMSGLADLIAENSRAAVDFNDAVDAHNVLLTLRATPSIERAWILKKDGQVFATFSRDDATPRNEVAPSEEPKARMVELPTGVPTSAQRLVYTDGRLIVKGDVTLRGETAGAVILIDDLSGVRDAFWRDLGVLSLAVLLSMLVFSMFSQRIAALVSRPISTLAKTARDVSENRDFSVRAEGGYGGEVDQLIDAFNEMLEQVEIRDTALVARAKESDDTRKDLEITLNSIGDGVIATDADGRITRMNPIAEEMTGWVERDAAGREFDEIYQIVDAEDGAPRSGLLERVKRPTRSDSSQMPRLLLARDGEKRPISDNVAPIHGDDGALLGIVIVCRDMSQQDELEERLRHAQKMEAVGQLAGGVAHDFNNLLNGILGYGELLQQTLEGLRVPEEEYDMFVKGIMTAGKRAADLTGQLLAFSRRGRMRRQSVDVHEAIKNVVGILRHTIDPKVDLYVLDESELAPVMGDVGQLENALLNLGVNARDAMPDGGTLTFATRVVDLGESNCAVLPFQPRPGKYVEISVKDTGTGISPEIRERIFEPFFTTKGVGRGTGLGLAAVYGTLEAHFGSVVIDSEIGEGTTFLCYLPVSEATEFPSKVAATGEPRRGKGCILLVDDEEMCRNVGSVMLRRLGYDVIAARSGAAGIKIVADDKTRIDLVLIDVQMPQMGGIEAVAKMREIRPSVPVAMASGMSFEEAGVVPDDIQCFLQKPYSMLELSQGVASALDAGPFKATK